MGAERVRISLQLNFRFSGRCRACKADRHLSACGDTCQLTPSLIRHRMVIMMVMMVRMVIMMVMMVRMVMLMMVMMVMVIIIVVMVMVLFPPFSTVDLFS